MPPTHSKKPTTWICDVRALKIWESLSGNERAVVDALWEDGRIYICNRVWREFLDTYPEEAERLPVGPGTPITDEYREAATNVAEVADSHGLSRNYDCTDYYVAGIASIEEFCIFSDGRRVSAFYARIQAKAVTIVEILRLVSEED